MELIVLRCFQLITRYLLALLIFVFFFLTLLGNSTDSFFLAGTANIANTQVNISLPGGTLFWKVLVDNGETSVNSSIGQFSWLTCTNSSSDVRISLGIGYVTC